MIVKVLLESHCKSCAATYDAVLQAVAELGEPIEVQAIHDVKQILSYRVWHMPSLVIDEVVVSVGKYLTVKQVKELIESAKK